jgi:hypothetical protein
MEFIYFITCKFLYSIGKIAFRFSVFSIWQVNKKIKKGVCLYFQVSAGMSFYGPSTVYGTKLFTIIGLIWVAKNLEFYVDLKVQTYHSE